MAQYRRPVVADHREAVAALESPCGKAAGENANLARDLSPGPGLPDAQVLLPERRPVGPHFRLVQQQARKGVGLFRHGVLLGRAPPQPCRGPSRRILHPQPLNALKRKGTDFEHGRGSA